MPGEFPLPVRLRRSSRAKHLRLVVKPTGLELVLPVAVDEARALQFLSHHRAWAEQKIAELRDRQAARPVPHPLANGTTVPFQGREVPLVIQENQGRRIRIEFDGRFLISLPAAGVRADAEQCARNALHAWVKAWMPGEAGRIIGRHSGRCGLEPRELRVKRMKSRWGSCGPRNDINLNWILAFTPPPVFEYVVVHELCHIRHRDHSPRFWELVGRHLPEFAEQRAWLRRHGGDLLQRFGA